MPPPPAGNRAPFLPTPSHGGRPHWNMDQTKQVMISTHALTWRATKTPPYTIIISQFLPTPSHGGRQTLPARPAPPPRFLPTPSHGGRHRLLRRLRGAGGDFYPRPHMEGDLQELKDELDELNFYPRPHMEGDISYKRESSSFLSISTHALTWRATSSNIFQRNTSPDFYPRPHMEGDLACIRINLPPVSFLPTPSHGGRRLGL